MPVDFSRFMVSGRGNRFEPLPETVIPRLKMPVVAEPAPAPAPAPAMPGTPVDLSRLDLSNLNIPMPVPQPIPQPVPQPIPAPAPPPVEVAPPPPPIPQISPEVLAQIQQEFNIPARNAPPPPVAPPVQVPPPVVQPEGIATLPQAPVEPPAPPVQVPPPVVQPAPPPPAAVAAPPPPIPEISPEVLAQIQQQFNLPDRFAPPPPPVAPPVQVPPPVVQPEPLAGPGMPTPSGGFLPGIDLNNLDLSGLAVPNQVQPAPAPAPAPFSPSEQISSNYIEPRDGPGQVPPGRRAGVDDPTGIETMAESVGQGDYLSIPLPDGSTFDLSTLDLSSIGGGGGRGYVDPSLYSDPGLGGGTRGEPLPNTRDAGPGFDPYAGVTGGLGPGGYGPEGGGFAPGGEPAFNMGDIGFGPVGVEGGYSYDGNGNVINGGPAPGGEPVFNPPQGAIDEAQGTTYTGNNFTPDLSGLNLDFSNLDLSGLDLSGLDLGNLNIGGEGGAGNNSYNPEDQGGPGRGNGPGFTMGGTDASGNGNTNTGSADTGGTDTNNPYPFIPPGINTSGMTPENLAGLNSFYEMYPNGFDYNGLDLSGIGNIDLSGVPGGTGTGDGSYTVTPVDPVGDLGVGDDAGSDPIDVTTPYVPPETRAASSYGLTGAVQTMPVAANPFRRPEAQQGIGSLAGGG